ncbi:bifunctional diaminohydroxyphosphoribosylaminopyrimidine deaminase/5-amino-6-(5-phosphoribosylamino)uracil reductase RibD [Parerythrobacter aurantius]|uniref:bifunctional diaminohydroxyphosphoribosylaminopyrimidine deaminase/5-amino-6-(5-phosphoribosylamino)uracil reductase RibD n=1 Tax=Parerythrobacter aurantius TaxID=3127706 RepID=UPI00324A9593
MSRTVRDDGDWLAAAARLASRGRPLSRPNPAVGCIVVRDGVVVGRGWTQPGGRPHAEAVAIEQAGAKARGATVYVTLEPCAHQSARGPSCTDVLLAAGPARVVVAEIDPDSRTDGAGIARLRAGGVMVDHLPCAEARGSLAGFLTRQHLGRPHVTLKLAISLDGCIALADGTSRWITGEEARAHVHSRRAMADAILVGGRTWRTDRPRLDVRLPGLGDRSPERMVLTRGDAPAGTRAIASPAGISALEGVQYLYVEGGANVAGAFLAEDLVDRLEIYRAPLVIGDGLRAIGALAIADLPGAHGRWHLAERRQLGSDCFEAYARTRN